jgi:DNA helicase-2/ATP-dependent DNA helicase PcrA
MDSFPYRNFNFVNLKYLKNDSFHLIIEFCEKIISIIKNSPISLTNQNIYKEYLQNNIELHYNDKNNTITLNQISFDNKNPFIYIQSSGKKISLNNEQYLAVIDNSQHSMIVACPGSGKTRTLTSKIIYLLDKNINPQSLFIATFTNKAAKEMMDRIKNHLNINVYDLNLGTFHGLAWKIIKKYYKGDSNLEIIDEDDQSATISNILKDHKFQFLNKITPRNLLRIISIYKNNCRKDDLSTIAKKYLREEIEEHDNNVNHINNLFKEYEKIKKKNKQFDFDDILIEFAKFLNTDDGKNWKLNIKYLFIDEFQDTNPLQDLIMENFLHPNLKITVVGDENQSIYGFRGSDVKLFWNFKNIYQPKVLHLKTNYRNPISVITSLNDLMKNNINYTKQIFYNNKNENFNKIKYNIFKNTFSEADYLLNSIVSTKSMYNCNYRDIAILSRTRKYWETLEMVLLKNKIPYKISGGQSLFEKAHIKDFIAFLKFYYYPKNANVWKRITSITPGVGKTTYDKIMTNLDKYDLERIRYLAVIKENFSQKIYEKISYLIKIVKLVEKGTDLNDIINGILGIIMPILELVYKKDFNKRKVDLIDFGTIICRFNSLQEFFDDLMLNENISESEEEEDIRDYVNITTVHHSKGLEWNHIFIIGCRNHNIEEIDEERRIFYVALSRTIKTCEITFAKYANFGGYSYEPLIFIDDMKNSIKVENRDNISKGVKDGAMKVFVNKEIEGNYWDDIEVKTTNIAKVNLEREIYIKYEQKGNFIDLLLKRMIVDYIEVEVEWDVDLYVYNIEKKEKGWELYYDRGSDNYLQFLVSHFEIIIEKEELKKLIVFFVEQIKKLMGVFLDENFKINEKVNYKGLNGELDLSGENWIIDIKTNIDGNIYKNDIGQLLMYEYVKALKDKKRRRIFLWFPLTNQLKEIKINKEIEAEIVEKINNA